MRLVVEQESAKSFLVRDAGGVIVGTFLTASAAAEFIRAMQ